jgi:MraZ protein
MDEKGRVSLPSAFRRGGADGDRFVLLQWEKPYLTLFPEAKWSEIEARLVDYRKTGPEAMNQVRVLFSGLVEVSPDKQGRILVPAALKGAAGLDNAVLLLGMSDRVELWDPETYDRSVEQQAGDLDQFAHRIFG